MQQLWDSGVVWAQSERVGCLGHTPSRGCIVPKSKQSLRPSKILTPSKTHTDTCLYMRKSQLWAFRMWQRLARSLYNMKVILTFVRLRRHDSLPIPLSSYSRASSSAGMSMFVHLQLYLPAQCFRLNHAVMCIVCNMERRRLLPHRAQRHLEARITGCGLDTSHARIEGVGAEALKSGVVNLCCLPFPTTVPGCLSAEVEKPTAPPLSGAEELPVTRCQSWCGRACQLPYLRLAPTHEGSFKRT